MRAYRSSAWRHARWLLRAIRESAGAVGPGSPRSDGCGVEPGPSRLRRRHRGLRRTDPRKDLKIVLTPDAKQQFVEGKVDAVLGFRPEPQEFRARKIGRVLVNTTADRPWSQYFCCFATGNRDFVRKHPVATKRALRALVKAVDVCAAEPDKVVRELVDRGFLKDHDYSLQALREIPYRRWRDTTPRTRPVPDPPHARGGHDQVEPAKDHRRRHRLRFVNELKKELKDDTRRAADGRGNRRRLHPLGGDAVARAPAGP